MRPSFQTQLINETTGDPGLWVRHEWTGEAFMFDIGTASRLSSRQLLMVNNLLLSHAHLDHLCGFDQLLRVCLHRSAPLRVGGPSGTIAKIGSRLASYTWNLLDSSPFVIEAWELEGTTIFWRAFPARYGFQPHSPPRPVCSPETLLLHPGYRIATLELDHAGLPCLAFRVDEPIGIGIDSERLRGLGYIPGGWLNELRQAIQTGAAGSVELVAPTAAGAQHRVNAGWLADRVARLSSGQSIAYLTDVAATQENWTRLVPFLARCDCLFCEAMFLDADEPRALSRGHLTAAQAGRLARQAGVRKLVIFHISQRYTDRRTEVEQEAYRAFCGGKYSSRDMET